jgi:hypothetical protein
MGTKKAYRKEETMNAVGLMKTAVCVLLLISGSIVLLPGRGYAAEKPPEIEIDLRFDREQYSEEEPIYAVIQINNKSKESIYISRETWDKNLFLEMRITDPTGRLLVARSLKPHNEFPDAPPLAYKQHDNKIIRPLPCKAVRQGKEKPIRSGDLRDNYRLDMLGTYSVQVQLSVMVFKGEPCSLENVDGVYLIKSAMRHFKIGKRDRKKSDLKSGQPRQAQKAGRPPVAKAFSGDQMQPPHAAHITSAAWATGAQAVPGFSAVSTAYAANPKADSASAAPTAEMLLPVAAVDVDPITKVKIKLSNVGKNTVVFMKVLGQEVYNDLSPIPSYTQKSTIDQTSFTLTYDNTLDPRIAFLPSQQIRIEVGNYDKKKSGTIHISEFTFWTMAPAKPDTDEDGIPDDVERLLLGTDPGRKTLFVRPKTIIGAHTDYWPDFIALFPSSRAGFAEIPAFTQAGIEISVIGDSGHPYSEMGRFTYDPSLDPNHPPCDILEILYMPATSYCQYGDYNMGHTYFFTSSSSPTWYWGTKGYVPHDETSAHYVKHGYFTPLLYPLSLETYFTEGAYPRIEVGGLPVETTNCGLMQCYEYSHASPLNLNDGETGPPFTQRPDQTVEFNAIVFGTDKKIIAIGPKGGGYERDEVRRRTIVHEMGHALLGASENDHCANPQCIMYGYVVDWELHDFGGVGACTHSPGGSKDIRAKGIVHNWVH